MVSTAPCRRARSRVVRFSESSRESSFNLPSSRFVRSKRMRAWKSRFILIYIANASSVYAALHKYQHIYRCIRRNKVNQTSYWKTTNLPTADDATSKSPSIYAVNALRICRKIYKIRVAVNLSISPGYAIIALRLFVASKVSYAVFYLRYLYNKI